MIRKLFMWLLLLLTGFFIGWFFSPSNDKPDENDQQNMVEIRQGGYRFINPLIECESGSMIENKTLSSFRKEVLSVISPALENKSASQVSVYYRDLFNGPWFGINEGENFAPASLLKVTVLMTYLKISENNPAILKKEIEFKNQDIPYEENINTSLRLEDGSYYTVDELLHRMIQHSDNASFHLLVTNINYDLVTQVHKDLGLPIPESQEDINYISVKAYASLFRVLYNASYLNRASSEKALEILSGTNFNEGITANLPKDIVVSHKFGIRDFGENEERQLHDCGIVYFPEYPYLLCIMTRGTDMQKLSELIGEISDTIFKSKSSL